MRRRKILINNPALCKLQEKETLIEFKIIKKYKTIICILETNLIHKLISKIKIPTMRDKTFIQPLHIPREKVMKKQ